MGSVKTLIKTGKLGKYYMPPTPLEFGFGIWEVSGRFSVGDLKELIPPVEIKHKAEALMMMTARFFETLKTTHPGIKTTYAGVVDKDGKITDIQTILDKGQTTNFIAMKLAHTPESFCDGFLKIYRDSLKNGTLLCGVADVESIFRKGFPLGSSTFKKIFSSLGLGEKYETLATYKETVEGLDMLRKLIDKKGLSSFPKLQERLNQAGLDSIPNPGFVLEKMVYDSTTKFEVTGDREITKQEEKEYSGLGSGYREWTNVWFPAIAQAQIQFCKERGILNIDGKAECVAYHRSPVVTDFLCTTDENRLMIMTTVDDVEWAIPSNKEIQRAIFRKEGIYSAIEDAKFSTKQAGMPEKWRSVLPEILTSKGIDIRAVSEYSCELMSYAIGEVANRLLGDTIFDVKPVSSWVKEFLPYASRITYQK